MEDWSIEAGKLLSREEFGYMLAASQGISYTEMMAMPKVEGEEVLDLLDYDSYFRLGKIRFPETRIGILQVLVGDNLIGRSLRYTQPRSTALCTQHGATQTLTA